MNHRLGSVGINTNYSQYRGINKNKQTQQTSFGSVALNRGVTAAMQGLERGGFLAEFLILDLLGMITPRTLQALDRNKEEIGHLNFKAGIEEFVREIMSGPPMTIIPLGLMAIATKITGPSVFLPMTQIKQFNKFAQQTSEQLGEQAFNAKTYKNTFIRNALDDALASHKKNLGSKVVNEHIDNIIADFEKLNEKTLEHKNKSFFKRLISRKTFRRMRDGIEKNIQNKISELNIKNGAVDSSKIIYSGENAHKVSVGNFLKDIKKYSKDITSKLSKFAPKMEEKVGKLAKEELLKETKELSSIMKGGRTLLNLLAIGGVGLYSLYIPKLYQRYKIFPGVDGLKEGDKKINNNNQPKNNNVISRTNNAMINSYLSKLKGVSK